MDLIDRQDAIDVIRTTVAEGMLADTLELRLNELPSAEKTGHWINRSLNILYPEWERYICSSCGKCSDNYDYCPHCGSLNRGEEE